jgi:hypothetical protein
MPERRLRTALLVGLVIFLAGSARDIQWHATHDTQVEFETASKQIEVHWLLWLGALTILILAALALRGRPSGPERTGYLVTLGGAISYAIVSVWHFIEHANGADPQVAHLFLYASAGVMVAGVLRVLSLALLSRRQAVTSGEG